MFLYDCVYNTRLQTCCWSGRALCIQFEKCVCLFHSSGNSAYQLAPLPSSWTQECSNNTERTQPFTREYEFPGREFLIFVSPFPIPMCGIICYLTNPSCGIHVAGPIHTALTMLQHRGQGCLSAESSSCRRVRHHDLQRRADYHREGQWLGVRVGVLAWREM